MLQNSILTKLRAYAELCRLHKPIGTLLLMWPMLIALWVASSGQPNIQHVVVYLIGCFLMRSAGCAINDFADRDFDPLVARTKNRPLAIKSIKPIEAVAVFILCSTLAFSGILFTTNILTIQLSIAGLLLTFVYPFIKRFTHLPQFFLGMAFAWSIPMAYATCLQALPASCWWLYTATLVWALAYDTEYALMDLTDDKKAGIKSTAILFGRYVKTWIFLAHLLTLILLGMYAKQSNLVKPPMLISLFVSFILVCYQQYLLHKGKAHNYLRAFLNNQWLGLIWFLGFWFSLLASG